LKNFPNIRRTANRQKNFRFSSGFFRKKLRAARREVKHQRNTS
jgi:hypothetical protein